jgi:hypothetical protein
MELLGSLLKTAIHVATTPIEVVKDVATMGGVLTDQDIKYYKSLLPSVRKTPEIARTILESIKEKVNEAYNISLGTYSSAGRDVSGFQYRDVWEFADTFKGGLGSKPSESSTKPTGNRDYSKEYGF